MVTVWISRLPQAPGPADPNVDAQETGGISDVRRVTYWWDGNGLVKKEISNVTADDDTTALPPASGDLIAAEVTNLTFEYFDGTNWVDTWDGTVLGDDGATPVGPPRAIRINIDVRYPSDPDNVKHYSKVVAINAGNAQPVAATTTGAGG
jgi:hypothetical protein